MPDSGLSAACLVARTTYLLVRGILEAYQTLGSRMNGEIMGRAGEMKWGNELELICWSTDTLTEINLERILVGGKCN